MSRELDHIDRKIVNLLQKNARMPVKDIAKEVFLSSPAVSSRIQHLESEGIIEGYHAKINYEQVGMGIKAFIRVAIDTKRRAEFHEYVESISSVQACYTITGEYAMLLEVVFDTTNNLDTFIQNLQEYGRTQTHIVFLTAIDKRDVEI